MTYEERLVEVCGPEHEEAARHVAQTVYKITECRPEEVARKIVLADKLGLDLTLPNQFSIVVRKSRPTHVIGWVGVRDMTMRTGQYDIVSAYLVHEGDFWECDLAQGTLSHRPKSFDEGSVVGAYAFAVHTKTGRYDVERMSMVELDKIRDSVVNWRKGPWGNWDGEMRRKSVLKRLGKRLGFSKEDQRALKQEDDETEWVRNEPVEAGQGGPEPTREPAGRAPEQTNEPPEPDSTIPEAIQKIRDAQEEQPGQPAVDEKPRYENQKAIDAAKHAIQSLQADGCTDPASLLMRYHPAFLRTVESIRQAYDDALGELHPSEPTLEEELREAGDTWYDWVVVLAKLPRQDRSTVEMAREQLFGALHRADITLEQAVQVAGELLG